MSAIGTCPWACVFYLCMRSLDKTTSKRFRVLVFQVPDPALIMMDVDCSELSQMTHKDERIRTDVDELYRSGKNCIYVRLSGWMCVPQFIRGVLDTKLKYVTYTYMERTVPGTLHESGWVCDLLVQYKLTEICNYSPYTELLTCAYEELVSKDLFFVWIMDKVSDPIPDVIFTGVPNLHIWRTCIHRPFLSELWIRTQIQCPTCNFYWVEVWRLSRSEWNTWVKAVFLRADSTAPSGQWKDQGSSEKKRKQQRGIRTKAHVRGDAPWKKCGNHWDEGSELFHTVEP